MAAADDDEFIMQTALIFFIYHDKKVLPINGPNQLGPPAPPLHPWIWPSNP